MTSETKSEVIIVTALAAFLAVLWWMNRAQDVSVNGSDGSLPSVTTGPGTPLFNEQAGPGATLNFSGGDFNIGGNTLNLPGLLNVSPGGCNCPAGSSWTNFGTSGDLAAWLAQQPNFLATAQSGLTDWS